MKFHTFIFCLVYSIYHMYYDPSVGTHIEQSLQLKTTWRVEQEASNCEPDGSLRRETSPSNFPPSHSVHVEWGFPVKITEFGNMYCEIDTKLLEIQQNVLCLQGASFPPGIAISIC